MNTLEQYRLEARKEFASNCVALAMAKDANPVLGNADIATKRERINTGISGFGLLGAIANPGVLLYSAGATGLYLAESLILNLPVVTAFGIIILLNTARLVRDHLIGVKDNPLSGNTAQRTALVEQRLRDINSVILTLTASEQSQDEADLRTLQELKTMVPKGCKIITSSLTRSVDENSLTTLHGNLSKLRAEAEQGVWSAEFELRSQTATKGNQKLAAFVFGSTSLTKAQEKYEIAHERCKAIRDLEEALHAVTLVLN